MRGVPRYINLIDGADRKFSYNGPGGEEIIDEFSLEIVRRIPQYLSNCIPVSRKLIQESEKGNYVWCPQQGHELSGYYVIFSKIPVKKKKPREMTDKVKFTKPVLETVIAD